MNFFAVIGVIALAVPVIIAVGLLSIIWRAWWLYPVWAWFISPLGVQQISFWHFAALLYFVSVITHHPDDRKDDRPVDWNKLIIFIIWPMVVWGILRWLH